VQAGDRAVMATCPRCRRCCFGTPQEWFCSCDADAAGD